VWSAIAENARETLMAGFATVQSLGSAEGKTLRETIDRNDIPRPLLPRWPIRPAIRNNLREYVDKPVDEGVAVVKLFATLSITTTGTDVTCGEAAKLHTRSAVPAHSSAGARAAILAACNSMEHGTFLTDDVLSLLHRCCCRGAWAQCGRIHLSGAIVPGYEAALWGTAGEGRARVPPTEVNLAGQHPVF
jgi:hypothetical protein